MENRAEMSFYAQQVYKMREEVYPKAYLSAQIIRAKIFMDAHFAEPISLGKIAASACFSKFHFIRLFKLHYGCTPHQYLASLRMQKAKQFLQKGFSVSETCAAVGFSSLSSFHRHFKRSMGAIPSALHKKAIADKPFPKSLLNFKR